MKNIRLAVLMLLVTAPCAAQQAAPKNFLSLHGTFDLSNTSHCLGIDYGRTVYAAPKMALLVHGNLVLPYRSENSSLSDLDIGGGSSRNNYYGNYRLTVFRLMPTINFFTSAHKLHSGFFLLAGLGATYSTAKKINLSQPGNTRYSGLLPGAEIGLGNTSRLSERTQFKLGLSLAMSKSQRTPYNSRGGGPFSLLMAKIGLGF